MRKSIRLSGYFVPACFLLTMLVDLRPAVAAGEIFQCERDGKITFQDLPCDRGSFTVTSQATIQTVEYDARESLPEKVDIPRDKIEIPKPARSPVRAAAPRKVTTEQVVLNRASFTDELRKASPQCRAILDEIIRERVKLRALRSEVRTQAAAQISELTSRYLGSGC